MSIAPIIIQPSQETKALKLAEHAVNSTRDICSWDTPSGEWIGERNRSATEYVTSVHGSRIRIGLEAVDRNEVNGNLRRVYVPTLHVDDVIVHGSEVQKLYLILNDKAEAKWQKLECRAQAIANQITEKFAFDVQSLNRIRVGGSFECKSGKEQIFNQDVERRIVGFKGRVSGAELQLICVKTELESPAKDQFELRIRVREGSFSGLAVRDDPAIKPFFAQVMRENKEVQHSPKKVSDSKTRDIGGQAVLRVNHK